MAGFCVGDLVRIRILGEWQSTGRIVALDEPINRALNYYRIEMTETGLIRSFPETQLTLIGKSASQDDT